jgi:hypothetical protein
MRVDSSYDASNDQRTIKARLSGKMAYRQQYDSSVRWPPIRPPDFRLAKKRKKNKRQKY